MDQGANKIPRLRRSKIQIEELLKEFEKGNANVAEFCGLHSISKAAFHKWQSRYRRKETNPKPGGFAKLKMATPDAGVPGVLFAEVHGIKLYQPVAASYLKELCRL
jgi:hypothetical protein